MRNPRTVTRRLLGGLAIVAAVSALAATPALASPANPAAPTCNPATDPACNPAAPTCNPATDPACNPPSNPAAPACDPATDPAALSVSVEGVAAGAGQRYTTLDISTVGPQCTITGAPTNLTFLDTTGAALATTPVVEGPAATPVTIDASHPAQLVLHTSPVDVGGQDTISPAALSFYLPGAKVATTITWTAGDVDGNGSVQYGAIQAAS
jgi:hypothetical protein